MQSPHEILGVTEGASEAEIERAYRRRVKETHPDQGGSVTEFLRVRTAYEELQNGHTAGGDPAGVAGPDARPGRHRRRNGHGGRGGRADDATGTADSGGADAAESTATGTVVEFLNYDVLVDRDWAVDGDAVEGEDGPQVASGEDAGAGGESEQRQDVAWEAPDLFERAATADLDPEDYGRFVVEDDESLLEAAERHGHEWPYSCRGGACANCAVAVVEGELSTPVNHILPEEMLARDVRLSCVGEPLSDRLRVVFNVKHLPELDELRLPPHPSS